MALMVSDRYVPESQAQGMAINTEQPVDDEDRSLNVPSIQIFMPSN